MVFFNIFSPGEKGGVSIPFIIVSDLPALFPLSSFLPPLSVSPPLPFAFSPFPPIVFFPPVLSSFAPVLAVFELLVPFFVAAKIF